MGIVSVSFIKQFLTKNILIPSTITKDLREVPGSVENITKIVMDNIPAQQPIIQTVIVPQEVIKYIEVTPTPSNYLKGKYSWYYPPLGGINCDRNLDGTEECDYLANGDKWEIWFEKGAACPNDFPLGTKIKIVELDIVLTCVDRGGAIIRDYEGYYWIDHLTNSPRLYWSSVIRLEVINE